MVSDAFCGSEENVYRLCQTLVDRGQARSDASDLMVVFISNENRQVSVFEMLQHRETREWLPHNLMLQDPWSNPSHGFPAHPPPHAARPPACLAICPPLSLPVQLLSCLLIRSPSARSPA